MIQEDLEKVVQIIFDNTMAKDRKEAVRLIIELVKAVEKPAEIRVVHDGYYPTGWPTWINNDPNKITCTGHEPYRFVPTCSSDISKNTHWEQPCSTTTAMNDSNLSYSATSSKTDSEGKVEKDKSLGDILDALVKAKRAEKYIKNVAEMNEEEQTKNKRGFAK